MNFVTLSVDGSRARFLALVAIVACLLALSCNAADTKIYLDIREAPGDVIDRGYKNQIAVVSYGVTVTPSGAGSLSLIKILDSSSPALTLFASSGTVIRKAVVSEVQITDGKKDSKKTIDLRDVFISSYQVTGNTTGGLPLESLSLNFARIEIDYSPKDKKKGGK